MPHTLPFLPHYAAAHARTLRQFIEAFWNEGCLSGAAEPAQRRLRLDGMGEQGQALTYHIDIAGDSAFGRLRLDGELRGAGPGQPGIATVVPALVRHLQPDAAALRRFVTELQHTALKQAWSATATPDATLQSPYALQEAQLGDGHPYHPCFRSRIGFSIDDHRRYGPEFAATVTLTWLAIARDASEVHLLPELDYDTFVRSQLGTEEYHRLLGQIEALGCAPSHYRLLPVHPWQWEHGIALHFADWLADSTLLHLGVGRAEWLAQQSIRSLSRLGADGRCNLKLPLAIANSSADRVLSDHHVHNAPLISRWLDGICRNDAFLADGQRLAILAEPAGITVAKEHRREGAYGMLGAIWRSAPESVLAEGEQVFPMTALTTLAGGQLTIASAGAARCRSLGGSAAGGQRAAVAASDDGARRAARVPRAKHAADPARRPAAPHRHPRSAGRPALPAGRHRRSRTGGPARRAGIPQRAQRQQWIHVRFADGGARLSAGGAVLH